MGCDDLRLLSYYLPVCLTSLIFFHGLKKIHTKKQQHKTLTHTTNRTTDNAQCNGHVDEHDTKEEEVYQDLCSIQRASRPQVGFCYKKKMRMQFIHVRLCASFFLCQWPYYFYNIAYV